MNWRLYDEWRKKSQSGKSINQFASDLDSLGKDIPYGLAYRIERSAYYVKSFETALQDMRTGLIEGFQPYPDFVRRRVGGTFEFIHRIGLGYRELRNEVELTLEKQRTEDTGKLQKHGIQMMGSIQHIEKEIGKTTGKMNENQFHTVTLLRRAEIFLGFGITYYLGHPTQEFIMQRWPSVGLLSFFAYVAVGIIVGCFLLLKGGHRQS